jgi:hypothetical protein
VETLQNILATALLTRFEGDLARSGSQMLGAFQPRLLHIVTGMNAAQMDQNAMEQQQQI